VRAIVTCQPGLGHLHPLVPLAHALTGAGFEVIVAVSPSFTHHVEAAGLAVVPAGLNWLESAMDVGFPDLTGSLNRVEGVEQAWRSAFTRSAAALLPDLIAIFSVMRPDVVVSESSELAGPLAAEVLGIRRVTLGIGPRLPRAALAELYGAAWNAARRGLRLGPDPALDQRCHLYLDACPPSMQAAEDDDRGGMVVPIRFEPYQVRNGPLMPWLDQVDDRPLILVTMGTIFNRVPCALGRVVTALGEVEHWRALVAAGDHAAPLGDVDADRIRIEEYVAISDVLDRVAAVVSHGGYNTTMTALCHGVPMLCTPLGADQYANARRVGDAGAGIVLEPDAATPVAIREAVRMLLKNPAYATSARQVAVEIDALPSTREAASRIARLVTATRK
jgi:UDP:flavonoid glycosyltransferase YjiC (YdhE family)